MSDKHLISKHHVKPLKVGVTGSIGSGKSTVCKIFEMLNVPVYYADVRAKELMTEDEILIKKIKALFGEEAYKPNGDLNRPFIASIVFKNPDKLKSLNAIVHPAVFADSEKWFHSITNNNYGIKEAALLIESNGHRMLDKLIVVTAPLNIRVERVMKRDQITREQVLERINNQLPESRKLEFADYIIKNDGESSLITQVLETHRIIISNKDR